MLRTLLVLFVGTCIAQGAQFCTLEAAQVKVTLKDNLFVRIPVPKKGVVCSNQGRVERIAQILENATMYEVPWGPKIYIGEYKGEEFFIASAPVGSGSGLMFTELYAAGAECIVRYGSDDVKNPPPGEENIIKIVDETDNLYGFNRASAVPESEWGKSIFASKMLINALGAEAKERKIKVDYRVCHHLENYHALRSPNLFSPEREKILNEQLRKLKRTDKKESFDMESAVLFRVAEDFGRHAIAVLQTVNKENPKEGPYEGKNLEHALQRENEFICFILTALNRIKLNTTLG